MTHLERLQQRGIRRLGTPKSGFRYEPANGGRITKADLERIDELRIPPAWDEVSINAAAKGRLQAIGRDAAGRWQYLYHENHTRAQETRKFHRLATFGQALPAMRSAIARNMKQTGLGRERVLACVLRILSTCFMRPGSQAYASEHGSYGIATLRRKHVRVKGDVVDFDFPGKSGVRQQRQLHDRQVAKLVRATLKLPGYNVFKYENGDGQLAVVTGRQINEYIKEVMGDSFSAKDFRTWAGTLICACALSREATEEGLTDAAKKHKLVAAIKETAEVLGNTPAVCRASYICPEILRAYERGTVIDSCFTKLDDIVAFRGRSLHKSERALLRFLKRSSK